MAVYDNLASAQHNRIINNMYTYPYIGITLNDSEYDSEAEAANNGTDKR